MSSTLIMPCAGKSSRFGLNKPKWMLTHPNGNLMLMESIFGLEFKNISKIFITVVKQHIEDSKINLLKISNAIKSVKGILPEFIILDNFTSSQSDTVYQTIVKNNITGPIFIKDCDNYFNVEIQSKNTICFSTLDQNINAVNKSYITLNKYGDLSGIVEKQVISDKFCVGGYSFENASEFKEIFEKLILIKSIDKKEMYISHIIQYMILNNISFSVTPVIDYSDWGTYEDWQKYTSQFKTIFIDLDGTLVKNSSEYFIPMWGDSEGLENNIRIINEIYKRGKSKIIITTSRKENKETLDQINQLGIKYHHIIFQLPHSQRILINDYAPTNIYPSAVAINLKRDQDNLEDYLNLKT